MFDKKEYDKKYTKDNYWRIALQVPKSWKLPVQAKAKAAGMSVNEYIRSLIEDDMIKHFGNGGGGAL